jgi:proteasome lid subunit RPN8/RPN11
MRIKLMNLITQKPDRTRIPYPYARQWFVWEENPAHPAVQVFMTQKAYQQVNQHANSDLYNEVGGWLLGRWCWDADNLEEFIVVDETLAAPLVRNSSTFLTFTQDTQVKMLGILEESYPEKTVVGWYHTHPRMSIFLSGYDIFLHENFFPHPWQVALVVEPYSHQGGFFIRDQEHQLDSRRFYGFYELNHEQNHSVVDWRNLRPGSPNNQELEKQDLEEQDDAN